jgi:hypothetical protein
VLYREREQEIAFDDRHRALLDVLGRRAIADLDRRFPAGDYSTAAAVGRRFLDLGDFREALENAPRDNG